MMKRLTFLLFIAGAVCAIASAQAQSTLTTPGTDTQAQPANARQQDDNGQPPMDQLDRSRDAHMPPAMGTNPQEMTPSPWTRTTPQSTRVIGPLKTKSEFEQYAEDATGRRLPVFGRQLFDLAPTTFAPVEDVPVPADYVLGPGDELLIRAWGKIELNARVTIDRNGQITLPRVGTLTVAGLHSGEVEGFLRSAIGGLFKDFELNVALGKLRSIQIFVLGEARQPGSYTVSSLSTLVDAVFTSGGPSATGTMRHIELRREGETISEFDLYDLMEKGDKSRDVRLLPGDVIFIPHIGPQVAVSGDVNTPGIFELNGSSTVGSVLEGAGGLTSLANGERVVLERIEAHRSRNVEEFTLDDDGKARAVKDGDLLRIFPLSPEIANAVTLRGNVAVPGLYPWKAGMRVSDLIPSRASLITRDYWNVQNHLVAPVPAHPFALTYADRLRNRTMDSTGAQTDEENESARTDGDQAQSGQMQDGPMRDGQMQDGQANDADRRRQQDANRRPMGAAAQSREMEDFQAQRESLPEESDSGVVAAVGRNSAEINWEYALVERLDERDLSTHLMPFRLADAIDNPASAENLELKPGDVITIFSRADIELPMEKHTAFVRVGGEVNAPGVYRVNPGDTLRSLVARAGSLTPHSYLYASIFTRVSTRKAEEAQLKQSSEEMQRELAVSFANSAPQPGQTETGQQAQLMLQQQALARLTSIEPTGRVVLAMKPSAQNINDIPDFPLEDGDTFYIPPRLSTVQVAGAVYNANAFRFEPGQKLATYLNAAGGPTRDADHKRMFVIRADGTVISRQSRDMHTHGSYENLKLLPGDAIVVPEKLRVSSKTAEFMQYTQLASSLALTAAALSVVK